MPKTSTQVELTKKEVDDIIIDHVKTNIVKPTGGSVKVLPSGNDDGGVIVVLEWGGVKPKTR